MRQFESINLGSNRMFRGRLVTVEGIDGSGKTTHIDHICACLRQQNIPVIRTREPGGTELGEALREILIRRVDLAMDAETELLLMFSARMEHLRKLICPALENGTWVVIDRFIDATYAYQGGGRGVSMDRIRLLENWVLNGLTPDLTILLDLPIEISLARTNARKQASDRFELQDREFKNTVREAYLERARQNPERIRIVEASAEMSIVKRAISDILGSLIEQIHSQT